MKSKLYVFIQFALILLIAFKSGIIGNIYTNSIFVIAIILGLWSIVSMKLKVSIFPDAPRNMTKFIRSGPYKYVRHPMYTSVLLATAAWVFGNFNVISCILWIFLIVVLVLKSRYEERQLKDKFPEYAAYSHKTYAIFPYIY